MFSPASTHVDEHVTHEDPTASLIPNTYQLGKQTFRLNENSNTITSS